MKEKKGIIVIIIVLALVLGFSIYFVYTNIKQSDLITKDTLFLCKADGGHLELVKASEEKHEKDICNGDFIGKYVCQNEYCGSSIGGQWMTEYADYEKGIVKIRDASEEYSWKNSFLYDFKNNKKLTEDLGFLMIVYNKNKKDKTYFLVENKNEDNGIIDNNGKIIIDFKYDDVGFNITSLENNSRDILLENKGIIFLRLKDKLGIYDLEQEKLITNMNLDKIGYYAYDGEYVIPLLSELFSQVDNYNLNQIYVEEDKVGKIINYKTGEVVKILNKTYDFVLPLDNELILVSENNTADILDNNGKSVLKEKIQGEANFNWDYDGGFELKEDDFKNLVITTKDKNYEFNIETRKLSEKNNSLITKDTIFLCPGEDERYHAGNNGILELIKASDNKHENEVCDGKFVGKYVCTNKNCGYIFGSQWFSWYSDYNKGVATIYDTNEESYGENGFLYDFKNSKKLTKEIGRFFYVAYEDNSKMYFIVSRGSDEGIIDSQGNMIIDLGKYDGIDFVGGEFDPDVLQLDGIYAVKKNNKYGFVDVTTGKEITKIEFDQYGYVGTDNDILRMITEMANRNSKEVYVVSNNVGKIINYKTGEVTRTLNKVYDYVFPLSKDLILVEEGNTFDILDENNKSVLKKKITSKNAIDLGWNDNDFKKFKIVLIDEDIYSSIGHGYIFDIDSRTLTEY